MNNDLIEYATDLIVGVGTPDFQAKPSCQCWDQVIRPIFPRVNTEKVLVIGDTAADFGFARNIGGKFCWAKYGYGHESLALQYPDFIIERPWHTIDLIMGNEPADMDGESTESGEEADVETDISLPSYDSDIELPSYATAEGT